MLCGLAAVLQASGFDGVAFDPFSFQQDGLTPPELDVGRSEVAYALVVAEMVDGGDISIENAGDITSVGAAIVAESLGGAATGGAGGAGGAGTFEGKSVSGDDGDGGDGTGGNGSDVRIVNTANLTTTGTDADGIAVISAGGLGTAGDAGEGGTDGSGTYGHGGNIDVANAGIIWVTGNGIHASGVSGIAISNSGIVVSEGTGILVDASRGQGLDGSTVSVTNAAGAVISQKDGARGIAIDVRDATLPADIILSGAGADGLGSVAGTALLSKVQLKEAISAVASYGYVYGNIELNAGSQVLVQDGVTVFDGVINNPAPPVGLLAIDTGAELFMLNNQAQGASKANARVRESKTDGSVEMTVVPVPAPTQDGFLLVSFAPARPQAGAAPGLPHEELREASSGEHALQEELKATRAELQNTIAYHLRDDVRLPLAALLVFRAKPVPASRRIG